MFIDQCNVYLLQVPPAPPNNQQEDIPPPDGGVLADPARVGIKDPIDMTYQGIVDYHPQPLAVSNFHLLGDEPLFNQ